MLPALALFMPLWLATPVSAALFSAHHMQLASCVPLAALGFVWAVRLRARSRFIFATSSRRAPVTRSSTCNPAISS